MQDIHITFPLDQFHALLAAFEVQFEAQQPEVTVLDFGSSYKQAVGYLVLEWADEVDESFIHQLTADNTIGDFCVYIPGRSLSPEPHSSSGSFGTPNTDGIGKSPEPSGPRLEPAQQTLWLPAEQAW